MIEDGSAASPLILVRIRRFVVGVIVRRRDGVAPLTAITRRSRLDICARKTRECWSFASYYYRYVTPLISEHLALRIVLIAMRRLGNFSFYLSVHLMDVCSKRTRYHDNNELFQKMDEVVQDYT